MSTSEFELTMMKKSTAKCLQKRQHFHLPKYILATVVLLKVLKARLHYAQVVARQG